jgi:1-carboxybiuret hydrolase subunit AtzG-like
MTRKVSRKPKKKRSPKSAVRPGVKATARVKRLAKVRSRKVRRKLTAPSKTKKVEASAVDLLDALVAASARALKLPIDPDWHAGVKFNLQLILRLAAFVDEFPLGDEAEPAPVFHA